MYQCFTHIYFQNSKCEREGEEEEKKSEVKEEKLKVGELIEKGCEVEDGREEKDAVGKWRSPDLPTKSNGGQTAW